MTTKILNFQVSQDINNQFKVKTIEYCWHMTPKLVKFHLKTVNVKS